MLNMTMAAEIKNRVGPSAPSGRTGQVKIKTVPVPKHPEPLCFGTGIDLILTCPVGPEDAGGANPIFDLCCHGHECLFNISRVLGRGLQAWNAQLNPFIGKLSPANLFLYFLLLFYRNTLTSWAFHAWRPRPRTRLMLNRHS